MSPIEVIKQYYIGKNKKDINNSSFLKFTKLHPEINQFLKNNVDKYFKTPYQVLIKFLFNQKLGICKHCRWIFNISTNKG